MRMFTHRWAFVLAAVFSAGMLAASASANTIIDHFNAPIGGWTKTLNTLAGPTVYTADISTATVLGGNRRVSMDLFSGKGEIQTDLNYYIPSVVALNSTATVVGIFTFQYGSLSELNADLSADPGFGLKFLTTDQDSTLTIKVESHIGDLNYAGKSASVNVPADPKNPQMVYVPFSSFGGVDFTDVDRLTFTIQGAPDFDGVLDSISTIPSPASAWAGGAVLCLIVAARARRLMRA